MLRQLVEALLVSEFAAGRTYIFSLTRHSTYLSTRQTFVFPRRHYFAAVLWSFNRIKKFNKVTDPLSLIFVVIWC